jgi:predicted permease
VVPESVDDEEDEEMDVPSPRDIRAARRSTVRSAFHLTLLFLLTVIIPSGATDAFIMPSNASYVATHSSALDLLDFSWVLVTWLDVLHGLCFGVMVTLVMFTIGTLYL